MKRNSSIIIFVFTALLVIGIFTAIFAYNIPRTNSNGIDTGSNLKEAYLIGISTLKYPTDAQDYLNAAEDARNMKSFLQSYAGFSENQTIFKSNEKASKLEIEKDLSVLDMNQTQKDVFIFYFGGHGDVIPAENAYIICPYDADETGLNTIKGVALQKFLNNIKTSKIICIFDCCESGGLIKDLTAGNTNSSKYTILTACSSGESAMEMQEFKEGIFTHYLIEGFKTRSSDSNNNGRISFEEAFKYAHDKTINYAQEYGELQNPQIFDGNPNQDVDLVQT